MDCLKNCVIIRYILCTNKTVFKRKKFYHNVEMNNKGILHFTFFLDFSNQYLTAT